MNGYMQLPQSPEQRRPQVPPSIGRRLEATDMAGRLVTAATQSVYEKAIWDMAKKSKEKSIADFSMANTVKVNSTIAPQINNDPLQFKLPFEQVNGSAESAVKGDVVEMDMYRMEKEAEQKLEAIYGPSKPEVPTQVNDLGQDYGRAA